MSGSAQRHTLAREAVEETKDIYHGTANTLKIASSKEGQYTRSKS